MNIQILHFIHLLQVNKTNYILNYYTLILCGFFFPVFSYVAAPIHFLYILKVEHFLGCTLLSKKIKFTPLLSHFILPAYKFKPESLIMNFLLNKL